VSQTVLEEAADITTGARHDTYGDAGDEFINVAKVWTLYLSGRSDIMPEDFVNMMILLKVMRARHGYHRDSYVDICGYAALAERHHDKFVADREPERAAENPFAGFLRALTVPTPQVVIGPGGSGAGGYSTGGLVGGPPVPLGGWHAISSRMEPEAVGTVLSGLIDSTAHVDKLTEAEGDRKWQSDVTNFIYWFIDGEWWYMNPDNSAEDPWHRSCHNVVDPTVVPEGEGPFTEYKGDL
jgi:hypothetical protein